jgi:hypothetical protein
VARKLRDLEAGTFHVYTHSVWAADALFRDDADRRKFLAELAIATEKTGWSCIAYCLMGTHYHLLLAVDEGVLPKGMHSLNFKYAAWFNWRHAMRGHVLGTRYNASRIDHDADLLRRYRYVIRNPVEAGLCTKAADWRWSSYRATLGIGPPQSFIDDRPMWACIHEPRPSANRWLQQFVNKA